ncbi:MAG: tryptophan--tRNA ligase [Candidatus Cloacimonadales bacterium]|jgi:tryptophanyl-tRNA synthetase|nr:tryptophan--tRNA ligase [Candidatus Cloacimonadota bacterium]MDX9976423.1 tryptophan--tRNA ligase [Candidatus Cloacimonadales bacterium]
MKRVFSGIKPTGDLHLGNYLGALKNWISLQDEYECIYSIVDLHAMTTYYEANNLKENVFKIACNYLACGLDPSKSILMIQSQCAKHAELAWILNCLTPVSWLERVPTFKEKSQQMEDNINMGLMDYPVLMTADIILYKAEFVPVGDDQLPHLELAREILRRFNARFGDVFPEIKEIIRKGSRVKGLDGSAKMGKSLDNCIYLHETPEEIWKKLSKAVTDPARVKRTDPGNPDKCNIYSFHQLFSDLETQKSIAEGCRSASIGCVDCKKILAKNMAEELEPIRTKYNEFKEKPDYVYDVLNDGNQKANIIAGETMSQVYDNIGINYPFTYNNK